MWKITIKQEYEYSYSDGTTSTGVNESTYLFDVYIDAMNFIASAIANGTAKTYAQIEEGEQ